MAVRSLRFVIAYKRQAMALLQAMDGDEARPMARLLLDMSARNVFSGTQADLARAAGCSTKSAGKALRLLCGRDFRSRPDGGAGGSGARLDVPLAVRPRENIYVVSPALARSVGRTATERLSDEYVNVHGGDLGDADPLRDAFVRIYRDPAESLLDAVTPTALRVAAWLALTMDRKDNTVRASVRGICDDLFPSGDDAGERHHAASSVSAALLELRGRGGRRARGLGEPFLALVRDGAGRARRGGGKGDDVVHTYVVNPTYAASFDEVSRERVERSFERSARLDEPRRAREEVTDERPVDWSGGARLERVTAGPGAGKTRLLASTAAGLLAEGRDVTCISYTNVAKDELEEKVRRRCGKRADTGRLRCMTIHMFILEHVVNRFPREAAAELELSFGACVGSAIDGGVGGDFAFTAGAGGGSSDVKRYIAEARSYAQRLRARNRVAGSDGTERPVPAMAGRQASWARRELGPDDLLWLGERLIAGTRRKSAYPARLGTGLVESPAQRAGAVAADHPYLLVDEFQDTTPSQAAVISALGRAGSRVCVVGDPAQAIFGFTGASASLFLDMAARSWGEGGRGGRLTRERAISCNHRSSGRITRVANALRGDAIQQKPKQEPGEPVTVVAATSAESVAKRAVEAGWTVITRTWANAFGDLPGVSAGQARRIEAATKELGGGASLLDKMADGSSRVGPTWRLLHDLWHAGTDEDCERAIRTFVTGRLGAGDTGQDADGTCAREGRATTDEAGDIGARAPAALKLRDQWASDPATRDAARLRDVTGRLRGFLVERHDELAQELGIPGEALATATNGMSVGSLADVEWRATRSLLDCFLVPKSPKVCTAHHAKGQEWEKVLVDIRPTRNDGATVASAFENPAAGARWSRSELPNVLYVACTRAKDRLCILVDGTDPGTPGKRSEADVVREALGRVAAESHDPDLFRTVTPEELPEGFWERGWYRDAGCRRLPMSESGV